MLDMPKVVRCLVHDNDAEQRICMQSFMILLLNCSGGGILVRHARCTGRAPLAVKLAAVHDAGREREPGQDARMPPRLEDGLRDDRVP